jgi:mannose-6-phosphate isomerase-like protein (cupin superfamily)
MTTRFVLLIASAVLIAGSSRAGQSPGHKQPGGYIVQHEGDIARTEPGTHNGGGQTVGYSFFDKTPGLTLVFRKRALKPGSAIGYHEQHEDEIYYVLSGHGVMTVDGKPFDVAPGTAVLTRPGSSHGIKQAGSEDLVLLINYEQPAK